MKKFQKPRSWDQFFAPLQKCSDRENAIDKIWEMFKYPNTPISIINGKNAMINEAFINVRPSSINIITVVNGDTTFFTLVDEDVFKVTANMIHIAVVIALFYSNKNIELVFTDERHRDIVFRNFEQRSFKQADDNYSSLKIYIYLLLQDRELYLDVRRARRFPKFEYHNSEDIIMKDNFQVTFFEHNFISADGVLSNQLRQLHKILYNKNVSSSMFEGTSMHTEFYSGIADNITEKSNLEQNKLTVFEEMRTTRVADKVAVYHDVAVQDTTNETLTSMMQKDRRDIQMKSFGSINKSKCLSTAPSHDMKTNMSDAVKLYSGINVSFDRQTIKGPIKESHGNKLTKNGHEPPTSEVTSREMKPKEVKEKTIEKEPEDERPISAERAELVKCNANPAVADVKERKNTEQSLRQEINNQPEVPVPDQSLRRQSKINIPEEHEKPPMEQNSSESTRDTLSEKAQTESLPRTNGQSGSGDKLMTICLAGTNQKIIEMLEYIPISLIGGVILKPMNEKPGSKQDSSRQM